MITSEQIYKKLLFKVNKNDTNNNIKIPKGVAVILFNEQKRKYLDEQIKQNQSTNEIENFEEILVLDKLLEKLEVGVFKDDYKLPEDFLKTVSSYTLGSKGDCTNHIIVNWFIKPTNLNVLLQNSTEKPSFEYQETLAILNSNVISVYKDGFKIDGVYISYYKNPPDIDIEGYIKQDGLASTNINTTLSDLNIDKIIDRTVVEIANNYEDVERLNKALQRQQQNEIK